MVLSIDSHYILNRLYNFNMASQTVSQRSKEEIMNYILTTQQTFPEFLFSNLWTKSEEIQHNIVALHQAEIQRSCTLGHLIEDIQNVNLVTQSIMTKFWEANDSKTSETFFFIKKRIDIRL